MLQRSILGLSYLVAFVDTNLLVSRKLLATHRDGFGAAPDQSGTLRQQAKMKLLEVGGQPPIGVPATVRGVHVLGECLAANARRRKI